MQSGVRWFLLCSILACLRLLSQRSSAQRSSTPDPSYSGSQPIVETSTRFIQLTADDGLAQNHVQAILQDRTGFLWIGTQDGLSRFDGYDFVTYRHDPQDPASLSHNFIRALFEDRDDRLWIATQGGGVDRFDPTTGSFRHYQRTPQAPNRLGAGIFTIFQDSQGNFWFGGPPESGLTKLVLQPTETANGAEGEMFTHYYPAVNGQAGFPGGAVWEILEDGEGLLWLAADQALVSLNPVTEQFVAYPAAANERRLAALWQDSVGGLWAGGSVGLYRFDPTTQQLVLYPQSPVRINDLRQDQAGQLWVSTHGDGLYRFDPQTEQVVQFERHRPNDSTSLSEDRLTALWQDRSGVFWIGSDSTGLNRIAPRQAQFVSLQHTTDDPNTLAANHVTAITGGDAAIWVGTGGILNRVDLKNGQVTQYITPLSTTNLTGGPEPTNTIYALYLDRAGFLWIGLNDNQVLRFDERTAQFVPYPLTKPGQPHTPGPPSEVAGFYEDAAGALWVVVNLGGLYRIDPTRAAITPVPLPAAAGGDGLLPPPPPGPPSSGPPPRGGGRLSAAAGDLNGQLWLGYGNGRLFPFDPIQQSLSSPPIALPAAGIEAIYVDHAQNDNSSLLWVGTHNGLLRVEPTSGHVQTYTERDGLPSSLIVGILTDEAGHLWLTTDKGLARFDPITEQFRNFDKADGLPGNEFSPHAAWQAPDGRLFFGGTHGIVTFYPQAIRDNPYQPPVVLTDLLLYNEPIQPGPAALLAQPIWATKHLTLRHSQGIITFEFAALDYATPQKNRYRYKLDGLEQAWNSVGSDRRFATYTSLPAGQYTFRVQGSNSDGLWSTQEVALALTVLPPWWQTIWFRGFLLFVVVGLAYVGYQWRIHAIEAQNRLLEAQVAQGTQALAESEARFRELATSAFEAILIHDGGRIVDANAAATALFGYPHAALVGKLISELLTPGIPMLTGMPDQAVDQAIQSTNGGALDLVIAAYEIEGLTATGRRLPLEARLRPIRANRQRSSPCMISRNANGLNTSINRWQPWKNANALAVNSMTI